MNILFSSQRIVKYKKEFIEITPDIILEVCHTNSEVTGESLYPRKDCLINKGKQIKKSRMDRLRWEYYSEDVFDVIKTQNYININRTKFVLSPYIELQKTGKLDTKRILAFDYSNHFVFRMGQIAPLSSILISTYIEGVTNKDFHIDEAYKHLKKRASVLEVEIKEIPYYNAERNRTKGLEMRILLPQSMVNKMWEQVKQNQSPSVSFKECLIPTHWRKSLIDPLGLRKFMRSEKEIKMMEGEY